MSSTSPRCKQHVQLQLQLLQLLFLCVAARPAACARAAHVERRSSCPDLAGCTVPHCGTMMIRAGHALVVTGAHTLPACLPAAAAAGAALYGLHPDLIRARASRLTYGVRVAVPYQDGMPGAPPAVALREAVWGVACRTACQAD